MTPASPAPNANQRDFGVYIHVPFCAVRCGYCDFNTYAPGESEFSSRSDYVSAALAEMALAAQSMAGDRRPARTVFFGGGTPTMLDAEALVALLTGVKETWGLAADAEVTTEANPDSVTRESLAALAAAGFTRVSLGMQSAVPHVLATLERTHQPENVAKAVQWAREAGLAVSLDLIYGTPGETLADWEVSLDAVLALQPDHVSAYALVIEPGTRMGGQLKRGLIQAVDLDTQADMYEMADARLAQAGYGWYEVSNWAISDDQRCRHNMAYWTSQDWWGVGPGAHSYLGPRVVGEVPVSAERWWNVKLPRAYAARLDAGDSPAAEREPLTQEDLDLETVMLQIRLREGIAVADLPELRPGQVAQLMADGLVDGRAALAGRLVLTLKGRLLADAVVRALT
ncbi:radical SAM family heme chaperone HemW [Demequina sp. B12]|uniref:radical SAM family heme chaperone HemW n=1 Tax=Demequina sp. B12 TaxID=2992757 RepID=UPI00237B77DC|nr:radical SAM family heme chaperone HemW [Demequina sp. B12]MDE0572841.1 radical SAM family heme chaperone HemW [Demequina sp. B12]